MIEKKILKNVAILTLSFFISFTLTLNADFASAKNEDILLKARILIQEGDFDGAIEELYDVIKKLKAIVTQKRLLAEAYYLLARVYNIVQMQSEFEKNLKMAFEVYPNFSKEESDPEIIEMVKKIKAEAEKRRMIEKPGGKKKKKFPVLLVLGGVVVAAVVVLLLVKKKSSDSNGVDPNYDTDTLGIEWVDIAAGEFLMGDNFNDGWKDEQPVHTVNLGAYRISKYEVTFDQYDRFCDDTSRNKPDDFGWGRGTLPVVDISWDDAGAFCDWLSQKTGKNIHLPTEAQWEKAARGTDQRKYPWGNAAPSCNMTNYNRCIDRTEPVGSYPSGVSPYGVHDMAGNAWEWCSDWYDPSYYTASPGTNPTGPSTGFQRVHRGGSWNVDAHNIRSINRESTSPSHTSSRSGFRLAWD